mmetsp:Transcript_11426/g.53134  ORF Transcript_11426/g.53134 Transcript_11426/m.53134 type:complete len:240 (-) Transcript_11426:199-918(-)
MSFSAPSINRPSSRTYSSPPRMLTTWRPSSVTASRTRFNRRLRSPPSSTHSRWVASASRLVEASSSGSSLSSAGASSRCSTSRWRLRRVARSANHAFAARFGPTILAALFVAAARAGLALCASFVVPAARAVRGRVDLSAASATDVDIGTFTSSSSSSAFSKSSWSSSKESSSTESPRAWPSSSASRSARASILRSSSSSKSASGPCSSSSNAASGSSSIVAVTVESPSSALRSVSSPS